MAKVGKIENNNKRKKLTAKFAVARAALKAIIYDKDLSMEDRFVASMKLAKMPRNGSATRVRNRCRVTGRPRGYYRKIDASRIILRELASFGLLPGATKSSW